jgi:hypothetical protein
MLRVTLAVCLTLLAACAPARVGGAEGGARRHDVVRVSPVSGGRLRLSFDPVARHPDREVLRREEARAVLAAFSAQLLERRGPAHVVTASGRSGRGLLDDAWEQRLRGEFLSRFGPLHLPLAGSLEESRLFLALKRSAGYMGPGIREAALELFNSPAFLASVTLSVLVYFAAWMAPEPLFSKAFAATLTVALALSVGVVELRNLARACLRLHQEAEAARTDEELEAAAQHFGMAIGGTALRVLVLVASAGLAKAMPAVPPGGMGLLVGPPRYTVVGGLVMDGSATATVVADGSLVVSGAMAGTLACGENLLCSTATLSTRYGPPHTRQNPPHNEAIERELAAREAAGHSGLRKNKAQVDAKGDPVSDPTPTGGVHFRRPDVSSIRPDGVRHNTNYVSSQKELQRELTAFESMRRADPEAIHELYQLDGTLVRRYVPPGVDFP